MSILRSAATAALRRRLFSSGSNGEASSHSDFARVVKKSQHPQGPESYEETEARIKKQLDEYKVVLYMKGLPSQPGCGFSWRTVQVLNAYCVEYKAHNILVDNSLREGIKKYSSWPTIPQLFINGEFIGGCDIVESMAHSGELQKALKDAGAYTAGKDFPDKPQSN